MVLRDSPREQETPHLSPVSLLKEALVPLRRCPAAPDSFPSALSFFDSHRPRLRPLCCTTVKEARAGGQGTLMSLHQTGQKPLAPSEQRPGGAGPQNFPPCQASLHGAGDSLHRSCVAVLHQDPFSAPRQDHAGLVSQVTKAIFVALFSPSSCSSL